METNKQWKRVPFDIELAKKIQSGEIEGRILCESGSVHPDVIIPRILCYDANSDFPIITLCEYNARIVTFSVNGKSNIIYGVYTLFIELPEETPKIYPYDTVRDKINEADWKAAKETFPDSGNMQSAFISGIAYQICKEIDLKKSMEHKFKPFDKVLVRDDEEEIWQPRLYEIYSGGTEKHYCQDGQGYAQCIPYEGNEHLVGATNNPE